MSRKPAFIQAGARRSLPLLFLLTALAVRAGDPKQSVVPPTGTTDAFRLFADVLEGLQKNYLDPDLANSPLLAQAAFREFVRKLDPEADLLTPDEFAAIKKRPVIADVTLAKRDGKVVVVAPRDGTAAQRTGVLAGDEILCHDNSLALGKTLLKTGSVLMVRGILKNAVKAVPLGEPVYQVAPLKILE